ncbi:two-component system response regulator VicR [Thermosporothrix hazakensis]|jgi:DNA-binding response OmpR family regulator|uniref:Two-component system response regulator VicR n=1 Tax=Thermosporothrix hazakensis TaxID=644383 RepID=A0A326UBS6_THEHA|nr:response regulator transcription factor [Thermosporothrix hazakensis]PZW35947.1 two-component system response regulator VicR [Thermosporothrix hazakensis]GCE46603.1 DNA-binding response regulator [Thermosporothrix hazakensis]
MKLLIVDTDRDWVEMLTGWLKTLGYEVCRAYTLDRAKREWEEQQPDLVILEPTMEIIGETDALALCRELRRKHDALILATTRGKSEQDEIYCLESGADDYLCKPFFPGQLLAHIRALTRRVRSTLSLQPSSLITVGPISIDALHNQVTVRGKTFNLTPTEGKLLHFLAINANNVCTANQIVSHIWGYGNDGDIYLIKSHIHHLRQKIEPDPSNPTYIITIRGVGYSLVRRAAEEDAYISEETARTLRVITG